MTPADGRRRPAEPGAFILPARAAGYMTNRPLDVLEETLGSEVNVTLKGGEAFDGVLAGYDQHMNLVLEEGDNVTIIRGDNVVSIRP